MIKSKGILTISIISLFAVESAYAAIASSGYVDQQVGTKISEVHATTVASDETANVVTSISADGNTVTATKGITAEETANKVTTIRTVDAATDVAYPSEKAVATALDAKQDKIEGEVLTNTATGTNSFSTGGAVPVSGEAAAAIGVGATAKTAAIAIGKDASAYDYSVALGEAAKTIGNGSVSVGLNSTAGDEAVAIGGETDASQNSVALGVNSSVSAIGGTALGHNAKVTAIDAIQLGEGTNSEANTLSVALSDANNYKLLGSDGKIPAERLPVANASSLGGVKSGGDISISSTGAVSVVSALKAVQDANGANIAYTYATKASVEDLNNNKVQKDWTTSNINKVLVIGSDDNYPDVLGKVTVARITENFLDDAIQNKLDTAVTNVTSSGTGSVIGGFSKSGNTMTVTRTNVQIPVGSATATSYASIWVE